LDQPLFRFSYLAGFYEFWEIEGFWFSLGLLRSPNSDQDAKTRGVTQRKISEIPLWGFFKATFLEGVIFTLKHD
jgi:hypothetical protein